MQFNTNVHKNGFLIQTSTSAARTPAWTAPRAMTGSTRLRARAHLDTREQTVKTVRDI